MGFQRLDGDVMSRKQLERTVRDGRLVTFVFPHPTVEPITGYVCGMDSFHWLVVDADGTKSMVHKGQVARIDLHDEKTYDDEPNHTLLETVVAPFRAFCERATASA